MKFNSTRGYNDPLNPSYQLPQVEMRPITPPKFIRDQISHDDIEGSRPKKQAYYETRSIMEISDIDGSKPRNLTNTWKADYSNMHYWDVTHADFKTKRSTNPLNPTYVHWDEDDKVISIGEIDWNKPKAGAVRNIGPVS